MYESYRNSNNAWKSAGVKDEARERPVEDNYPKYSKPRQRIESDEDDQPAPRKEWQSANSYSKQMESGNLNRFEQHSQKFEQSSGTQLPRRTGKYVDERVDEDDDVITARNNSSAPTSRSYTENNNFVSSSTKSNEREISANRDLGVTTVDAAYSIPTPISLVMVAPAPVGTRNNQLTKCLIIREKESFNPLNMTKMYPTYQLILEETNSVILIAKKMNMNKTSNYHIFDMTRGHVSSNLTKKSGNYIGKLRAKNFQRTEYALLTQNTDSKEEIAGIVFDRFGIYDQLKEGTQPRKISVIVPELDKNQCPIPFLPTTKVDASYKANKDESSDTSLVDLLKSSEYGNMYVFESKDPVYEKGNYRLNFNGRVTVASVKNFQLVPPTNINNIVCQFGKIGAEHFHLDYKSPLNAIQAFALALCQFNI